LHKDEPPWASFFSFTYVSAEGSPISKVFLSEGHISYYTLVPGPDILRNVIVVGYVTFFQINKFSLLTKCLCGRRNGFADRMKWLHGPDLARGP